MQHRCQNIYGVVAGTKPIDADRRQPYLDQPHLERSTLDTLLLNLAYISYVTASLMPSGLKLRLGLIAQSIAFITWGVVSGTPTTVAWSLVFVSINIYKAVRIIRRDAVALTADEESVRSGATLYRRFREPRSPAADQGRRRRDRGHVDQFPPVEPGRSSRPPNPESRVLQGATRRDGIGHHLQASR